jgi:hypothetical protein
MNNARPMLGHCFLMMVQVGHHQITPGQARPVKKIDEPSQTNTQNHIPFIISSKITEKNIPEPKLQQQHNSNSNVNERSEG